MNSDSIKNLAAALVAAQGEFSAVPKGSTNPFFKSKYAALPDVVASAGPVLAKHGLAVAQFISESDTLTTYVLHTSGEFISHAMTLHLVKDDPQAQGSAVTYARRYAYMSALGLVADDDDDGNSASRRPSKPTPIDDLRKKLADKFSSNKDDIAFFLQGKTGKTKTTDLDAAEIAGLLVELG